MSISEHITPFHLGRKALIYIRQSSPHQALNNQEGQHPQYALRQRARECGWADEAIEVIDTDLVRTASTTQGRQGFKEIVARVTLDRVGIIFSDNVTRLSRNCTDWYQVLDLCGYRPCLIGDRDGVYDPATIDGRLLLGLKGQLTFPPKSGRSTRRAAIMAGPRRSLMARRTYSLDFKVSAAQLLTEQGRGLKDAPTNLGVAPGTMR